MRDGLSEATLKSGGFAAIKRSRETTPPFPAGTVPGHIRAAWVRRPRTGPPAASGHCGSPGICPSNRAPLFCDRLSAFRTQRIGADRRTLGGVSWPLIRGSPPCAPEHCISPRTAQCGFMRCFEGGNRQGHWHQNTLRNTTRSRAARRSLIIGGPLDPQFGIMDRT